MTTEIDIREGLDESFAEGMEKGLEKGMEKGIGVGREEKALETARNLKNKAVDIDIIAQCTGLSIERVKEL